MEGADRTVVTGAAGAAISLVCCGVSGVPALWARRSTVMTEPEPQSIAPLLESEPATEPGLKLEQCTCRSGALGNGNDAAAPESGHTLATAVARCAAIGAVGFTFCCRFDKADTLGALPLCYFKTTTDGTLLFSTRSSVHVASQYCRLTPPLGIDEMLLYFAGNDDPEWTTVLISAGKESDGNAAKTPISSNSQTADSGSYCQRCSAKRVQCCVPICAFDCVDTRAIEAARRIVERMLENCQPAIVHRMAAAGCSVAVIGRAQVTSDMPPHNFLKGIQASLGQRSYDDGCRGVGGTVHVPCTSVGEENLLGELIGGDPHFKKESILIHEFSHAVMNVGLTDEARGRITSAFANACESGEFDNESYMMSNAEEFWAEGAQAWFHASMRSDVNCGINTRDGVIQRVPELAALLREVFGDGTWRYDTSDENCHAWSICNDRLLLTETAHKSESEDEDEPWNTPAMTAGRYLSDGGSNNAGAR